MRIYLASNWDSKKRMAGLRDQIEATTSHNVCARWLDEQSNQNFQELEPDMAALNAYRDLGEICTVDLLIIDTAEESNTGGREVEYGFALGAGRPVWVVGPDRNIFHAVSRKHFTNWVDCLRALAQLYGSV